MLYNILVGFLVTLHWFRDTRSQTFTKKKRREKKFSSHFQNSCSELVFRRRQAA